MEWKRGWLLRCYLLLGMQYIQCAFWDLARLDLPSFCNGNRKGMGRMIYLGLLAFCVIATKVFVGVRLFLLRWFFSYFDSALIHRDDQRSFQMVTAGKTYRASQNLYTHWFLGISNISRPCPCLCRADTIRRLPGECRYGEFVPDIPFPSLLFSSSATISTIKISSIVFSNYRI